MSNDYQRGRSTSSTHLSGATAANNSYQSYAFDPQYQSANDQQFLDPQATLLDFSQQDNNNNNSGTVNGNGNYFNSSQLGTSGLYSPSSSNLSINNLSSASHSAHNLSSASLNAHNLSSASLNAHNLSLNVPSPQPNPQDTTTFPNFGDFDPSQALDPSLLYGASQHSSTPSLDPMAATHHAPTPPHLLQPDMRHSSQSPSPRASPSFQQPQFGQATRQRSESLDPASAAYPPPGYRGNDWATGHAFQSHRRTPSEAYSDISSHSNQASPYLSTADSFDASPMLNPQADPSLFSDALGLSHFSLSDTHISPGGSPHVSPRLMPQSQQPLPDFIPPSNFGMSDLTMQNHGGDFVMFPPVPMTQQVSEPFPQLTSQMSCDSNPGDLGQADTMSPPEINIDFAPPSRQPSFGPPNATGDDALSPPERNRSRNRMRAKSDTFVGRPATPSIGGRGRSPSLQPGNSLSPLDARHTTSRSPSPSSHSSVASGVSRRSSTSSVPQRDYILDLANPERSTINGGDPKRIQKHPATFQCTLCPKKFTRAYNLRSHLRTHTDERPFVCTVCGKAFARQHDRKRHESLHSGEKKFVCKGQLGNSEQWGCGRRFARADALGRHFRSEAGRVCIKPLLDEEAAERQRLWAEEHAQQQMQSNQGFVAPPPMMNQPHLHPILPAALLQMYPDLANLDWGAVNAPPIAEEYNGRSSFDASSGAEWDLSENEMTSFGNQQTNGMNMAVGNNGWTTNQQQQDYLSDY